MPGLIPIDSTETQEQLSLYRLPGQRPSARSTRLLISSDSDIVIARQHGKALALAMNFSATEAAFIVATVSELARVLLSLSLRGEIWLHQLYEPRRAGVLIVARDSRSRNISALALPDVSRLVDEFHIASDGGRGTTITATKWRRR